MSTNLEDDSSAILNESLHNENSIIDASHNLHSSISDVSIVNINVSQSQDTTNTSRFMTPPVSTNYNSTLQLTQDSMETSYTSELSQCNMNKNDIYQNSTMTTETLCNPSSPQPSHLVSNKGNTNVSTNLNSTVTPCNTNESPQLVNTRNNCQFESSDLEDNTETESNIDTTSKKCNNTLSKLLEKFPEWLLSPKTDMPKDERAKKQADWIREYDHTHVKLTPDRKEIETIGDLPYDYISSRMLQILCRPYSFPPVNGTTGKKALEMGLIAAIRSGKVMDMVKQKLKAKLKPSKSTKPTCVKKEGTLFRLINVITSEDGKPSFINTMNNYDREDLDRNKIPHEDYYTHLLQLYSDTEIDELSKIQFSKHDDNSFMAKTMDLEKHDPSKFDTLKVEELKAVVDYIIAQYKATRAKNCHSGTHGDFANFVHGKMWLLYLHQILDSLGDRALTNCCFSELSPDVLLLSSDMNNVKSSQCSKKRKQVDDENSKLKKKLLETKLTSMSAFGDKSKTGEKIAMNRRLTEIYELLSTYKPQVARLKLKFRNLKQQYRSTSVISDDFEVEYEEVKIQYNLKKQLVRNLEKESDDINKMLKNNSNVSDDSESDISFD